MRKEKVPSREIPSPLLSLPETQPAPHCRSVAFGRAQRVGAPLRNSALAPSPLSAPRPSPFRSASASDTPYSRTRTRHCQGLAPLPLPLLCFVCLCFFHVVFIVFSFLSLCLLVVVFVCHCHCVRLLWLLFYKKQQLLYHSIFTEKNSRVGKKLTKQWLASFTKHKFNANFFFFRFFFFFFFCLAYTDRLGRIK